MAWSTPRDWTAGELVTEAIMDTHVRDQFVETWHRIARKTADESVTSSTALQTDDHLTFAVAANEVWALRFMVLYTAAAAGEVKFAYSFPSGTAYSHVAYEGAAGAVEVDHVLHSATDNSPFIVQGFAANALVSWDAYFVNGGSAGTFALRWAQGASSGTATTLLTNSILLGMKVA